MARLTSDTGFQPDGVIQFDNVIVNIGGGYIANATDPNYGKFIAPVAGSYRFIAGVFNRAVNVGVDLMVNGEFHIAAGNEPNGAGMTSTVAHLEEHDVVYLENPEWALNTSQFDQWRSFFSGHLIHPNV